jgi:hypothetical protein
VAITVSIDLKILAINSTKDPHALLTAQPRTIGLTLSREF